MCSPDDAECRPVPASRQRAGIAMRENHRSVGHVLGAERSHAATRRHVIPVNRLGFGKHSLKTLLLRHLCDLARLARHPRYRPCKVHRGGARSVEQASSHAIGDQEHLGVAIFIACDQRQCIRCGDANRRCASNDHRTNRGRYLVWLAEAMVVHLAWQQALVEHDHIALRGVELDGEPVGSAQGLPREARAHSASRSRRSASLTTFGLAAPLVAFMTCPTK